MGHWGWEDAYLINDLWCAPGMDVKSLFSIDKTESLTGPCNVEARDSSVEKERLPCTFLVGDCLHSRC